MAANKASGRIEDGSEWIQEHPAVARAKREGKRRADSAITALQQDIFTRPAPPFTTFATASPQMPGAFPEDDEHVAKGQQKGVGGRWYGDFLFSAKSHRREQQEAEASDERPPFRSRLYGPISVPEATNSYENPSSRQRGDHVHQMSEVADPYRKSPPRPTRGEYGPFRGHQPASTELPAQPRAAPSFIMTPRSSPNAQHVHPRSTQLFPVTPDPSPTQMRDRSTPYSKPRQPHRGGIFGSTPNTRSRSNTSFVGGREPGIIPFLDPSTTSQPHPDAWFTSEADQEPFLRYSLAGDVLPRRNAPPSPEVTPPVAGQKGNEERIEGLRARHRAMTVQKQVEEGKEREIEEMTAKIEQM